MHVSSRPVPLIFIIRSYAALYLNEMLVIKRWLFSVCLQTEQFVHALKDELVKSALLALHAARPGYVSKCQSSAQSSPARADPHLSTAEKQHSVCNNVDGSQTPRRESRESPVHSDSIPHHKEYDEEEWASASLHGNHASLGVGMHNIGFFPDIRYVSIFQLILVEILLKVLHYSIKK